MIDTKTQTDFHGVYPDLIMAKDFAPSILLNESRVYRPIIKERGFCPNPVAKYGIPVYADSRVDPSVKNTMGYKEYWDEQINYCVNGYTTGGLFIPGRYYFYLNFCPISTVGRGYHYPDFVDADYEYFIVYEEAKRQGKGVIIIKARRRGMSEKYSKGVIGYGMRFRPEKYKAGIVAGLQTYSDGLFNKFKEINSVMVPEFYLNSITSTNERWIAGQEIKNQLKAYVKQGSFNELMCKTAATNENVLKSNYFDDVAFEEGGEFDLLVETFGATKDCLMDGRRMEGTPMIFGTGGNIQSQSKGFMEMWYDADSYNLIRFDCFGPRLLKQHYIGSTNKHDSAEYNCPNLIGHPFLKEATEDQLIGCEDHIQAIKTILDTRTELRKLRNKKKLYDEMQNNPLNAKEAFLNFGSNPFDTDILSESLNRSMAFSTPRYEKYKLDWVRDAEGKILIPLQVEAKLARDDDPEEECVLVVEKPEPDFRRLDVAGIDSYDVDEATTSRSQGGMVVTRRKDIRTGEPRKKVVCVLRQRPRRKEIFYETSLKIAVWYNLIGNVMIDYGKPMIIDWWKKNHGRKYLAKRPQSMESDKSEQTHEFGFLATIRSKPIMISLMQGWVLDEALDCPVPILLNELQAYDTGLKESDCDLADALGLSLVRITDMKTPAIDYSKENYDPFASTFIQYNEKGEAIRIAGQRSLDGKHYTDYQDEVLKELVKQGRW